MAAMVAVVLLATSASSLSRQDPAFSGVWQDWGDGVWDYYYFAPTNSEFWRFKSNLQVRFAYKCTPGQWWHYSIQKAYFTIGAGNVGDDFLGDDHTWHVVDAAKNWAYTYWADQDCGYWMDTSQNETRFAYKYATGQWWDYTLSPGNGGIGWGQMGIGALATAAFVGDGQWHTFSTANIPGGKYL